MISYGNAVHTVQRDSTMSAAFTTSVPKYMMFWQANVIYFGTEVVDGNGRVLAHTVDC